MPVSLSLSCSTGISSQWFICHPSLSISIIDTGNERLMLCQTCVVVGRSVALAHGRGHDEAVVERLGRVQAYLVQRGRVQVVHACLVALVGARGPGVWALNGYDVLAHGLARSHHTPSLNSYSLVLRPLRCGAGR